MSSSPSVFRELVAHLTRAQRAVDAGHFDEAERAVSEVLAIDPGNVHATDLQHRIALARGSGRSRNGRATKRSERPWAARPSPQEEPAREGEVSDARLAARQVAPAAWSTFEARVRARRADRAVANAQAAIAAGDREAAAAALAELDIVSPDDPRRLQIADYVELLPVEPLRPQWPPEVPLTSDRAVAAQSREIGDLEIVRPAHLREIEIVKDPIGRVTVRATTPPTRPSRVGRFTAAAGLLIGALMLGWALTRPSFVDAPARAEHDEPRAETPIDPTSASIPAAAEALEDAFSKAIPDPTLLVPSTDAPPAIPAEPGTSPMEQSAASGPASDAVTDASATSAESITSARPPAPSNEQARAQENAVPPPALDQPVQALSIPAVKTAPAAVDPSSGSVAPVALPAPSPAAHTAALTPASPALRPEADATAVRGVLEGYASAYTALDAEAAQHLWPGVDLHGLRRAFEQLSAQTVQFDRCDVKPAGDEAQAECVGRTTWIPRVGDRSPRSEARTWQFALARDGNDWLIERVQVKR
jgi:hypothetical protein